MFHYGYCEVRLSVQGVKRPTAQYHRLRGLQGSLNVLEQVVDVLKADAHAYKGVGGVRGRAFDAAAVFPGAFHAAKTGGRLHESRSSYNA